MNSARATILARLAFRSLSQNWRHSLATMLAILGGFAAVSLFDGFLQAIRDLDEEYYVNKGMVGHVIVERTGAAEHAFEDLWKYSLAPPEQEKISKLLASDERVKVTMRYLLINGLISSGDASSIFLGAGYDENAGSRIRGPKWDWNTIAGLPLKNAPPTGGMMVGKGLAARLGCVFDETTLLNPDGSYVARERPLRCPPAGLQLSVTTEHGQVNALTLPVTGVGDFLLREFNNKVLSMPLPAAQALFDTDRISRFIVLLDDARNIDGFLSDFRARTRAEGLDVEAIQWIDHPVAAVAKGGLEIMGVFRALFLAVVALIAAMSVANSMMKSINERVREIGTLRSFGFRRLDIVLLFSFEGLFLGAMSCAVGIVVTAGLAWILSHVGITFKAGVLSTPLPLTFSIALRVWLTTALSLSLITFLASWIVSRRAARREIADALRHTA
jgi:putative ABC transport system permease protein